MKKPLEPPYGRIDKGIRQHVRILFESGIETFESCEGGSDHPFSEPTVRFHGDQFEGMRAFAIAQKNGLQVDQLRRYWSVQNGEPVGPYWEITFCRRGIASNC